MIPKLETNKVGSTVNFLNGVSVDFSHVYVARANDKVSKINSEIAQGNHIVFQPGIYKLDGTILVNKPNIVLLGLGMATLQSDGSPCI